MKSLELSTGLSTGYSLLELLMTLALMAVLLTIGLPSFGAIAANSRLRSDVDALFHAVHLARTESIARRRVVSICPSNDGRYCSESLDWSNGWIVFVNKGLRDTDRRDDDEVLLRGYQPAVQNRITANRRGFSLRSTDLRATNGTVVFCDRAGRVENRALVISYTGRPRVTRTKTNGQSYQCAD